LTIERASRKTICKAWIGSRIVEKPLLSPVTSLEHSDEISSILSAISIEILLGAKEYNGETFISRCFKIAIETPFECWSRTGRAECKAE
jgi:hypothetical protein